MGFVFTRAEHDKKEKAASSSVASNVQHVQETTDIAATIKELNRDEVEKDGFSPIDMKAAIHPVEVSAILCVDTLVVAGMLPLETAGYLTRKKLRLSVSQNSRGRDDIVHIAQGMSQNKTGENVWQRLGNVFSPNK